MAVNCFVCATCVFGCRKHGIATDQYFADNQLFYPSIKSWNHAYVCVTRRRRRRLFARWRANILNGNTMEYRIGAEFLQLRDIYDTKINMLACVNALASVCVRVCIFVFHICVCDIYIYIYTDCEATNDISYECCYLAHSSQFTNTSTSIEYWNGARIRTRTNTYV